ncbi:hypothetical protein BCR37DRAFT_84694 [Protomyces lactucae-debilis]|uniref:Uncharacterized protein n=1 Tax=Protomyces lactucae-debilis TaxID=2754530 RepID=A0A1Y2F8S4_PROLT|nr:uncharacterized protein BCR37DRAFT_84694 [Protomyces lactucae-debilis]ORY80027.1 hypothetical protein BCR37DRAFT_84694 [Protomyces lactucae-debilis]
MARPKGSKSRPGARKPGRASATERAAKAPGQARLKFAKVARANRHATASAALADATTVTTPIQDGDAALHSVASAMPVTMTGVDPASQSSVARNQDDVSMVNSNDPEKEGDAHNTSTADMAQDATDRSSSGANAFIDVLRDSNANQSARGDVNNDDPTTEATTTEESDGSSVEVDLIHEIKAKIQDKRIKLYEEGSSFWIHPPDPSIHLSDEPNHAKVLVQPSVFVWHPALWSRTGNRTGKADEEGRLPCPRCKGGLRFKGWCESPPARRIHDDGGHFLLMAYRYFCKNQFCSLGTISAADTELLESLPHDLQLAFPAILSHRSGISKQLFERFQDNIANDCGPDPCLANIRVSLSRKREDIWTPLNANMPESGDKVRSCGESKDPLQSKGLVPSVHWLTDLFTKDRAKQKPNLHYINSGDPIVCNLGPTGSSEQPVNIENLAASAPVPRPIDLCAPEIFIEKGRHASDVRRVCNSCSLNTCSAHQRRHCVLHPQNLSRAERSLRSGILRPDALRLWNCWHVLQYEYKRHSGLTMPTDCTTNRMKLLDKFQSDIASRSSKLLGFLRSDANFIQDVLKVYIEERTIYNPCVQGTDR